MSTIAVERKYTPEDLLTMPDGDQYELVDGELRVHDRSAWSSYVAGQVLYELHEFCERNRRGWCFGGGLTYQCFPGHLGTVRKPAASFIRLERLSPEEMAQDTGHTRIAPDVAVEVPSPGDSYIDVERRIVEWLGAGTPLVWVVNPDSRLVHVHRAEGTSSTLRDNDELSGEGALPGFRCKVRELFLLPTEVASAS